MKVVNLTKIRFVNVMSEEVVEIKINRKRLNSYTLKDVMNKFEEKEKAVSSPYCWVDELTKKVIFDGFTTFNTDLHLSRPLNSFLVTSKIWTTLIFPHNPSAGNLRGGGVWSRSPPSHAASSGGEDKKKTDLRSIFVFNGTIDSKIYVRVSYTSQCTLVNFQNQGRIGYDNFPTKDVVFPAVEIRGKKNWEQVRLKTNKLYSTKYAT